VFEKNWQEKMMKIIEEIIQEKKNIKLLLYFF